jgi:L-threonylcarbamoyladenylate synthase
MNTLRLDPKDNKNSIQIAARLLQNGELVAFPTETVYGLGACIFNEQAVKQIFIVKGRPQDNPLIAHISSLAEVDRIATNLPGAFYPLANAFFPGPLTLVVPRNKMVPAIVSASTSTIAIRMPHNEIALSLIRQVGEPLVAPSANVSGKPSPTTVEDVLEDLEGKIPAVVDGGPCTIGIESTVLDLTSEIPTILRPGAITKKQIEHVLLKEIKEASLSGDEPQKAPGMKYRHYAPDASIYLISSWDELRNIPETSSNTLLLANGSPPTNISVKEHLPLSTATVYQAFRHADRQKYSSIIIFLDAETKQNTALMNRIEKAAAHP